MSELVTIRSCASQQEAELLKTLLDAAGIQSAIMADDYAGLLLMTSGGVELQVLESDAAAARLVLEEKTKGQSSIE